MYTGAILKTGMIFTVGMTIPFYVAGYFPPERQGNWYPSHAHVEVSSSYTMQGQVEAVRLISMSTAVRSVGAAISWPVK